MHGLSVVGSLTRIAGPRRKARWIIAAGTVLLLAAAPSVADLPVRGGTGAQQRTLRETLGTLPACLIQCAPVSLEIRRSDDGEANYEDGVLDVSDVMLGGAAYARYFETLPEREPCLNQQNAAWAQDLRRTLLHELAHHLHEGCEGGTRPDGGTFGTFLALPGGYRDKLARLERDAELERLENERDATDQTSPRFCAAQARVVERFRALGFASRGVGDAYADTDGGEYIAVALETLVYDHAEFCRSHSDAEMRWLHTHLGACLNALTNRAPCYDRATTTQPEQTVDRLQDLLRTPATDPSGPCDL